MSTGTFGLGFQTLPVVFAQMGTIGPLDVAPVLAGSLTFVWGLAGWCYWKILSGGPASGSISS